MASKKPKRARARTARKSKTITLRLPREVAEIARRAAALAGIPEGSVYLAVLGLKLAALERAGELPPAAEKKQGAGGPSAPSTAR